MDGHSLFVLASQLRERDRLTRSDLASCTGNRLLERSLGTILDFDCLSLKFSEIFQNFLLVGELPHPSEAEPLPLADVDAERIFDILPAPIYQLHHDRVLRVRDREADAKPSDPHRMPDCVLRSGLETPGRCRRGRQRACHVRCSAIPRRAHRAGPPR